MFDSLRKKLKSGLKKLGREVAESQPEPTVEQEQTFVTEAPPETKAEESERIEKEEEQEEHLDEQVDGPLEERPETLAEREPPLPVPALEDKILKKEEQLEKKGFLHKLRGLPAKVREKELSAKDIDSFISELEADLLYSNVALEVIDFFREALKEELVERTIKRGKTEETLKAAFEAALLRIVDQGTVDLAGLPKPATLVFLGFNGAGKTTSIAKVAQYFKDQNKTVVLAAADTFRAASIEQLEHHGKKLGVRVIKHQYGGDPAAVVFDAKKHAKSKGIDIVLADTAGRTHIDKNLLDELKKVVRVNKPDLKILVVDSLTGNDAVEQAKLFHEAVGVDAVMLTKLDVNKKGGSLLSVAYAIKKPILFLGTGQEYKDLIHFDPRAFVKELLE